MSDLPGHGKDPWSLERRRREADALVDAAHVDQARLLYAAMLDDHRTALGVDHPATLEVLANLAWCNETLHAFPPALGQYTELHQRCLALLGEEHDDTLSAQRGLMNATGAVRGADSARLIGYALVGTLVRTRGPAHEHTWEAARAYAHWLWLAGRGGEARDLYAHLYHALPEHHPVRDVMAAEYDRHRREISRPRRMNRLPDHIRRYSRYTQQQWRDGYID
ncbi:MULTISPECIES: hypothetical protein [unclassified Saccharothrix]|uniref:hypothetical protein n=1 Tax=unclassified Saccharothrix TaxID=2593673 RepID=UPI00307F8C68